MLKETRPLPQENHPPEEPREQHAFDFRAHFCHSAPMGTHDFGFRLRANAPEGQKRFPISEPLWIQEEPRGK